MSHSAVPDYIWDLSKQLHRRKFPLGIEDYKALIDTWHAGFGLVSREALTDVLCLLWAKSRPEQEIIHTLVESDYTFPDWDITEFPDDQQNNKELDPSLAPEFPPNHKEVLDGFLSDAQISSDKLGGLPPFPQSYLEKLSQYHFVYVPEFPVTYREVAQAWRRLRQPVREGPPAELDFQATISQHIRKGVPTEIVLVPRRRNKTRLLLFVDRQGSMGPFHSFIEMVCNAILDSANLENILIYYFHDTPVQGADKSILIPFANQLFPIIDSVLSNIEPFLDSEVCTDPELQSHKHLKNLLDKSARGAAIVVISDAGAARGNYDPIRILNTIAFIKALKTYTQHVVWLNPLPKDHWRNNTSEQLARYIPMFPLNRDGIYNAVEVLRGRPYNLEQPI
jgi:uncharacterized protein